MPKQNLRRMITLSAVLLAVLSVMGQKPDRADLMFEAAAKKERVDGDLKAAIEQYRKIAVQFAKQPDIAARALFQLGQCQEKLGQAEARKAYEQIVREYGGAQQYASAARARLVALGGDAPAVQQATRVVWSGPKVSAEASLSPDGRFMTFPNWDTGNLGLHDLVTGADRALTNTGSWKKGDSAFAEVSAISRDGKQAAYAWHREKLRRYELWIVNLNGDPNPRRLFGSPDVSYIEPRDWSPDGKWIVAGLWGDDKAGTQQIGLIGVQDGSLRVLKSGPRTDGYWEGSLSSDGKYIVSARKEGGVHRGYILSVDGKTEVPLISRTSSAESPVWTPDGSHIVFTSDRSGSPGLWSVRVADGKPFGEPELLKPDCSNCGLIAFNRDGSLFYHTSLNLTDIFVAGLDPVTGKLTSEPRRVNQRGVGNSWGNVAWLPDGKAVSFWNRKPITAVVVHTLETGEEHEIMGGKSGRPATAYVGWFPDGTLMRSQRSPNDNKATLYRREDISTGETRASWTVSSVDNAVYSPDLATIYFWQREYSGDCENGCTHILRSRDIATGRDNEVTRINAKIVRHTSTSRDGRYVAFMSVAGGAWSVMIAPTAGGAARTLYAFSSEEHFVPTGIAWLQDSGHVLVFCRLSKGDGEVWSVAVNGGTPEKSPLPLEPSEQPVISPDGTQVAFVAGSRKLEMSVMTGLFPNTKAASTH